MLSETVLKHLNQFCDERRQNRAGQQEWDAFLVHAYREAEPPSSIDLRAWLRERLEGQPEIEALLNDYQRIGSLFRGREELKPKERALIWEPKEPAYFLSGDLSKPARRGGAPVGIHTRDDEDGNRLLSCSLSPEMRRRNPHLLVVGNEATGKSQLMINMCMHDIESGDRAVVMVDTDGTFVDGVLAGMKEHPDKEKITRRMAIIDPSLDGTMRFNPIDCPADSQLAVTAIMRCFRGIDPENWSQHTEAILRNCLILLMLAGKTLDQLPSLLCDAQTREKLIEQVAQREDVEQFETLLASWENYTRLSLTEHWQNRIEPILNVIEPALRDEKIGSLFCGGNSAITLKDVIANKMILAVRVPRQEHGNAGLLLSSLVVGGIQWIVGSMPREVGPGQRTVALYIDELDGTVEPEIMGDFLKQAPPADIGVVGAIRNLTLFETAHPESTAGVRIMNETLLSFGCIAAFAVEENEARVLARLLLRAELQGSQEEKNNIQRLMSQSPGHFFWRPNNRVSNALSMTLSATPAVSHVIV